MWGLSLYRGAASYNRLLVLRTIHRFKYCPLVAVSYFLRHPPLHKTFFVLQTIATSCTPASCRSALTNISHMQQAASRKRLFVLVNNNNNVFRLFYHISSKHRNRTSNFIATLFFVVVNRVLQIM